MEIDASHTRTVCLPLSLPLSLTGSLYLSLPLSHSFLPVSQQSLSQRVAVALQSAAKRSMHMHKIQITLRIRNVALAIENVHISPLAMGQRRHEGVVC